MRIAELDQFFIDLNPAVRQAESRDGLQYGSRDAEITGVATTHTATTHVIHQAIDLGCNIIITHDAIFYGAGTDKVTTEKSRLLEEHNTAIYRLHDLWEDYKDYGIVDSWAGTLGLGDPEEVRGFHKAYDVPTQFAVDFAKRVRETMGLGVVRVAGDLQTSVSRVGLGPGEHGQLEDLRICMEMGANCFLAGESSEWQTPRYAIDAGICMMTVGHTESENPGMEKLAEFLKQHFRDLRVEFLDAGNVYNYV